MSIIHDALKKIQQGQSNNADGMPPTQATPPTPGSDYAYSPPTEATQDEQLPVERLSSSPKKARSVIALLCTIALIVGVLVFCFKQLHPYIYRAQEWSISSYYKLIHQERPAAFKTKKPKDFIPLAKITVNPPQPSIPPNPTTLPNPTQKPIISTPSSSTIPQTLNIHGVMSNGPNNLVLINDQVYQEGDDVDGVKIVKINLDTITVINNGKEETIRVKN